MNIVLRWFLAASIFSGLIGCATIPGGQSIHMPEGEGPFPVVLVLHTSAGLKRQEREFAAKLSRHGYVAVAVNWWDSRDTELTGTYDFLITQPYVDPERIGLVGFSRGGRAALWFASRLSVMKAEYPIAGVVNYYQGNSLVPWVKGTKHPPTLFLHGELDERVEPIEIISYCKLQRSEGTICTYHFYKGVRHAFDRNVDFQKFKYGGYDGSAKEDAWKRTLAFFDEYLKRKN